MKICVNGEYIELTAEEIAALQSVSAEQNPVAPTAEERITALEEQFKATKILLGVE